MTSLRERKKRATRAALIETARRLFSEKGYEATTLEEICEEVQIHVTTFFSYFESKEELAFARMLETLQMFREQLHSRPDDVDVLSFWWEFLDHYGLRARNEESRIVTQIETVPALRSRFANIVRQYEDEITVALAKEAGNDPEGDLYARLLAANLMSAVTTAARWYSRTYATQSSPADTAVFAKLILSKFPPRSEVEKLLAQLREANTSRKPSTARGASTRSRKRAAK